MKRLLIGSMMIGLLLSGCGQASSGNNAAANSGDNIENSSVDLSSYPEGVRNGTVSMEYHNAFYQWFDKSISKMKEAKDFSYDASDIPEKRIEKSQSVKDVEYEVKLINEGFSPSTSTEAEQAIQSTVNEIIYNQELYLKYKSEYLSSLDSVDFNLYKGYGEDYTDKANYLIEQLKQYKMFTE